MKKLILFLTLLTLVLMATVAFAGDVSAVPVAAVPAQVPDWIYTAAAYVASIVTALSWMIARFKLNSKVHLAPDTPGGALFLLFFKLIWQIAYQCKLFSDPPPTDILRKPITGPTNTDTAKEAMEPVV
jgi:hypothetical protein